MLEVQDFVDRHHFHARAEPDDEYYPKPPRDPHQIHPDQYDIDIDEEEEEDQDERYDE